MKLVAAVVAALTLAAPASAMRWLDAPGHAITVPGDLGPTEATGPTTAVSYSVTVTPSDEPVNCDAGSPFPVGTTTVHCTADDADPASFNVTVVDTTPPSVAGASPVSASTTGTTATVSFASPTAHDLVDGDLGTTCSPPSGTAFPLGSTTVTCTATDSHGNTGSTQFDVNVVDVGDPTIGVDAPAPAEATSAGGATVTYLVHASDNSGSVSVSCDQPSGSLFAIATTHVTCTASDASGNHASTSFDVTVHDTTPPTLTLPAAIHVEADSAAGKIVTYTAGASDAVSGPLTPTCTPASGSAFPVGTTTVSCTAHDAAGNTQNGSFSVTVTDASGPNFSSVPGVVTAEANGPGGSVVNYTSPTAVDAVDGPQLVSCSPASHTLFPLGTTTVHCSAADNHGNSSAATFGVAVVDTTPPTLAIPGPTTVYATTPLGIPETAAAFIAFRHAATADDIVDPHPTIGDNLGSFAEIGTNDVGFVARDASGNATAKATQLIVLPMPPAGTPALPAPPPAKLPADVANLQTFPGNGFVRLVWGAVPGAARYLVYRAANGARRLAAAGHGDLVYTGTATTYTDRGLQNGIEYRYVVVSEDAAGNQSAGVAAAAVPRLDLLRAPRDGARLKQPPKLVWARNAEAAYYNVQLYRGQVKILSTWPLGASVRLKRSWKYAGRRYTLAKGVYRWYVWPGFGARARVDYGELMGSNSFVMIR